jgi:PKD repeat protein
MKRAAIFAIALAVILACSTLDVWAAAPRRGLVAEYLFDGDAKDTSGNNNDGVVHGAVLIADRFQRAAKAYYFNGKSSYIQVPNSPGLQLDKSLTIAAWVNIFSFTGPNSDIAMLVSKAEKELSYELFIHNGNLVSALNEKIWNGGSVYVPQKQWHHVAFTWDGSQIKYYLNGVQDPKIINFDETLNVTTHDLYLGRSPFGGAGFDEYLHGKLDDVRIYNRALSAAEIDLVYRDKEPVVSAFTVTQDGGAAPLTADFKCLASSPNGKITKYLWDVNGDGVVDFQTDTGMLSHVYSANGTYSPRVMVVDWGGYKTYSDYLLIKVGDGPELAGRVELYSFDETTNSVSMKLRIYNWGNAPASYFSVIFLIDNNVAFKNVQVKGGLAAGQNRLLDIKHTFDESIYGRPLSIAIDWGKKVNEVNEMNNGIELFVGAPRE